jgi:hypothetical protein
LLRWIWKEGGFVAIENLPLIPQKDHRKAKNHPQNGAANVVHEVFFPELEDVEDFKNTNFAGGTGSIPPTHQGWQRPKRLNVK